MSEIATAYEQLLGRFVAWAQGQPDIHVRRAPGLPLPIRADQHATALVQEYLSEYA